MTFTVSEEQNHKIVIENAPVFCSIMCAVQLRIRTELTLLTEQLFTRARTYLIESARKDGVTEAH
jgi:hypothetical protein